MKTLNGQSSISGRRPRGRWQAFIQGPGRLPVSVAACLVLTSCTCMLPGDVPLGPSYHPANTFAGSPVLPPTLKRVAVLPLVADENSATLVAGRAALEPVLLAELTKTHKFEVVRLGPTSLRYLTGKGTWCDEETLPADFFSGLRESAGCDAVLFCQLTVFRGYAPLAVGWRLRLVDVRTRNTLWATDEVFDAGQPSVRAGARRYQLAELSAGTGGPEEWVIQNSPTQFGQYTAAQLLATLPGH